MMSDTRRRGRPRDEAIDAAVMDAVLALVEEEGLRALTIDGIAERACASKATIYRRWASKDELVVDAVACIVNPLDLPETETIREGLLTALTHMGRAMSTTTAGQVFPWVVGEIAARSDIGQRYMDAVVRPGRHAMAIKIREGVERGELRSDLDIELAVDMLMGPILVRKLTGVTHTRDVARIERHVDYLLTGWASGE